MISERPWRVNRGTAPRVSPVRATHPSGRLTGPVTPGRLRKGDCRPRPPPPDLATPAPPLRHAPVSRRQFPGGEGEGAEAGAGVSAFSQALGQVEGRDGPLLVRTVREPDKPRGRGLPVV